MSNNQPSKSRYYGVCPVEIREVQDKEASFLAVASTSDVGRDGHIVKAEGWDLENYLKNPIVPFVHSTSRVPVAKSIETKVQGKRLMFRPRFGVEMPVEGWPKDVPHPSVLYPLYTNGYLNAFSVSWEPLETPREMDDKEKEKYLKTPYQKLFGGLIFEKQELLEISVVPLPADPKALKRAYSDGIDSRAVYGWLQSHQPTGDIPDAEKPLERFYLFVSQEAGDVEAPGDGKIERQVDSTQGQEQQGAEKPESDTPADASKDTQRTGDPDDEAAVERFASRLAEALENPTVPATLPEAQERLMSLFRATGSRDLTDDEWDEYWLIEARYDAEGRNCPDAESYEEGELGLIFHELGDNPLPCFSQPELIRDLHAENDDGTRIIRQCACGAVQRQLITWNDTPIWKLPTDASRRLTEAAKESPDALVAEASIVLAEQHQKYMARAQGAVLSTTMRAELERVVSHLTGIIKAGAVLPESSDAEAQLGEQQMIAEEKETGRTDEPDGKTNRDDLGGNVKEGEPEGNTARSDAASDGDVWVIELEENDPQSDPADAERTSSEEQPPADALEYDLTEIGGLEGLGKIIGDAVEQGLDSAIRRRAGALE